MFGKHLNQALRRHVSALRGTSLGVLIVVMALCLGVVVQILGVETAFWNLMGSEDMFTSSLLEGFAILSAQLPVCPVFRKGVISGVDTRLQASLIQNHFFHPPLSLP